MRGRTVDVAERERGREWLMLQWWFEADAPARRALVAASLGWMLDAFDVMLYALVLRDVRADLSLSADVAGGLQSLTLLASAAGGLLFGILADRWGRTRALMLSVLVYSIFTAACGSNAHGGRVVSVADRHWRSESRKRGASSADPSGMMTSAGLIRTSSSRA